MDMETGVPFSGMNGAFIKSMVHKLQYDNHGDIEGRGNALLLLYAMQYAPPPQRSAQFAVKHIGCG